MCVRQRVVTRLRAKSAVYISRSRAPMTVAMSVIRINTYVPFILLFAALLIALAFEFVNGFDDTAAGRAGPARRQQRRLCHGVRPASSK